MGKKALKYEADKWVANTTSLWRIMEWGREGRLEIEKKKTYGLHDGKVHCAMELWTLSYKPVETT